MIHNRCAFYNKQIVKMQVGRGCAGMKFVNT